MVSQSSFLGTLQLCGPKYFFTYLGLITAGAPGPWNVPALGIPPATALSRAPGKAKTQAESKYVRVPLDHLWDDLQNTAVVQEA